MKNVKLLLLLMLTTLIYSACSKLEEKTQLLEVVKSKKEKDRPKEEQKYIDRIMLFEKLSLDNRKKISNGIKFTNGIPTGINGNLDIFRKMSKKDLLSFYETLFDNNSVAVIDGSDNMDRIIVQSVPTLTEEQLRKSSNGSSNWAAPNCWVSVWKARNAGDIDSPCENDINNQCLYYNYRAPGCR